MADEYGNLEVGLEILDENSGFLPKVDTASAIYALVTTDELETGAVELPLHSGDPIPAGYRVIGARVINKSTTLYDESTEESKSNGNSAMYVNADAFGMTGGHAGSVYAAKIDGRLYRPLSSNVLKYLEVTVVYALAPGGGGLQNG